MRPFKKIAGIAMSLALTAAMILPAGVRAEDTVEPIPDIKISVSEGQDAPSYQAGDSEQELKITLENTGKADAKNVKIIPVLNDASEWPFNIENMTNEVTVGDIASGQSAEAVWDKLTVRSDVGNNTVRLFFKITCDDGIQNQFQTNKYVFVRTKEKPKEEKPEEPKPEENGEPEGGEAGFSNSDPVVSGGGGGSESGKDAVPRVIVTGFNTDPGAVNAGSDFKLIIHLKNTSTKTAVSNMLFDLQAPSSGTEAAAEAPAFLPSSGSSSIYLDYIPAGGTQDISIALNARADLVQKPYSIAMTMKYEDSNATQYESSSSLAIPVKQAARFEFSELEIAPEAVAVGEEANITCSLYNTGRIKLYNVKAKFQGDGIEGKDVFVGNVDSGATGSIDGIVTATQEMAPDQKCKMIVSYEDESGKASTVEKEFSLTITPEQAPMDMSQMVDMPAEKGFPVLPVVIGAVVVVAAIVILIIVLKRRKKKKESVEEEDLLDEVDRFTEDE
ncbi:hypothetical protein DWX43_19560 [Clostridium sp. AF19-22AC]|uniref:COG1361 S-layer family protein n=1 Tax=Clostridia TaxID=186801 RepID=UPI000E48B784|nr:MULTISPECIES: hypothetical protein [Clostridia]RHR24396.1 hypothetical protein DWX43_19560 [Clostridium sp. AF19-22AC]